MLVHGLHAREQPLPVVFPRPSPFVRIRLHFHLATSAFFPGAISFQENLLDWLVLQEQEILAVF